MVNKMYWSRVWYIDTDTSWLETETETETKIIWKTEIEIKTEIV